MSREDIRNELKEIGMGKNSLNRVLRAGHWPQESTDGTKLNQKIPHRKKNLTGE